MERVDSLWRPLTADGRRATVKCFGFVETLKDAGVC